MDCKWIVNGCKWIVTPMVGYHRTSLFRGVHVEIVPVQLVVLHQVTRVDKKILLYQHIYTIAFSFNSYVKSHVKHT